MHFETSAGFHKKLLKRKQSNLKSILVFERKKNKQKKPLQLWRKSGSEAWATNISYFAFGRLHVRFESQPEVVCRLHHVLRGTDQDLVDWTGHRPRRLGHRTGLWGERERRKKWWLDEWRGKTAAVFCVENEENIQTWRSTWGWESH